MFDSLKSKLKAVFQKGKELDAEKVYETAVPEKEIVSAETPAQPVAAPIREQSTPALPKKLSRKEEIRQRKKNGGKRAEDMLSTSVMGKKIKDDPLDDLLDQLEVTLLESDVAYPVVQEIILGVRNNLAGRKYSREYTLDEIVEIAVKDAVEDVLAVNSFD
ncbi:MAG: signal recognition particle receptor subunit alpha, partial [Candidatus Methanomethylophilus sp.]|nr:signal recognition particle receptor subunit alpha [Methanomethylophilus sp.]